MDRRGTQRGVRQVAGLLGDHYRTIREGELERRPGFRVGQVAQGAAGTRGGPQGQEPTDKGSLTPEDFRTSVAPLIGEGPAADIAHAYQAMSAPSGPLDHARELRSELLGITPRTTRQWLTDMVL